MEFVKKNMQYPSIALKNKIEGMAVIQFIVDEKGWIKHPIILKHAAGGCGNRGSSNCQINEWNVTKMGARQTAW